MKITYYAASSLDGYIAKEDGDVSWLEELNISMEDTGYDEFYSTVDALVMGRKTYEMVVSFGPWPYGDKPVWVCSSKSIDAIEGCNLQNGKTPLDAYNEAQGQGVNHLWLVGGGKLAASFLEEKLLTHLSISQMPIILGGGIRLFGDLKNNIKIQRISIEPHKSGFTQMDFLVTYLVT
jgi:dihydrofolate reductase